MFLLFSFVSFFSNWLQHSAKQQWCLSANIVFLAILIFIGVRAHDAVQWTCYFAKCAVLMN